MIIAEISLLYLNSNRVYLMRSMLDIRMYYIVDIRAYSFVNHKCLKKIMCTLCHAMILFYKVTLGFLNDHKIANPAVSMV